MKTTLPAYLSLILLFSSCKAFKSLTARDNSATNNTAKSSKGEKQVTFLDNISVTPGTPSEKNITAARARKNAAKNNAAAKKETQPPAKQPGEVKITNPSTNNATLLQAKYAVVLNVGPEELTNIPLLETIDRMWGTRYCYGGQTEDCIDCSGFTQLLFSEVYKMHIPRVAQDQYDSLVKISSNDLREGDLVFFHTSRRGKGITHVGVYVANNKFAHASTSEGVTITDLDDPYWKQRYRGAARPLNSR